MHFFSVIEEKWTKLCDKTRPFWQKTGKVFRKIWSVLKVIGSYLFRMRALFLTIPVAVAAVWMAIWNGNHLPQDVGIWLQSDGSFSVMVPRQLAVMAPLAITALCVLFIIASKKTVYPWLISVFSLVLPVLIYFVNAYPA